MLDSAPWLCLASAEQRVRITSLNQLACCWGCSPRGWWPSLPSQNLKWFGLVIHTYIIQHMLEVHHSSASWYLICNLTVLYFMERTSVWHPDGFCVQVPACKFWKLMLCAIIHCAIGLWPLLWKCTLITWLFQLPCVYAPHPANLWGPDKVTVQTKYRILKRSRVKRGQTLLSSEYIK